MGLQLLSSLLIAPSASSQSVTSAGTFVNYSDPFPFYSQGQCKLLITGTSTILFIQTPWWPICQETTSLKISPPPPIIFPRLIVMLRRRGLLSNWSAMSLSGTRPLAGLTPQGHYSHFMDRLYCLVINDFAFLSIWCSYWSSFQINFCKLCQRTRKCLVKEGQTVV